MQTERSHLFIAAGTYPATQHSHIREKQMAEVRREPLSDDSNDEAEEDSGLLVTKRYLTAETPLLRQQSLKGSRDMYRQNALILILVCIFLFELGVGVIMPAVNALMEHIICRDYYPEVSDNFFANEPRCKNPDVQGKLAMLRGWAYAFNCIPGILCTVPYGILSDRVGRKLVLVLTLFGTVLSFVWIYIVLYFSNVLPLWTTWFSSAWQLIGGTPTVAAAMVYTMGADIVPAAERAMVFFHLNSCFLFAEMISGPLAGILLHRTAWLALFVGLALFIFNTLVVALVFPETLDLQRLRDSQQASVGNGRETAQDVANSATLAADSGKSPEIWTRARAEGVQVWNFILKNQRVTFLMFSVVFVVLGKFVTELLLQYATKRYGWTWDKAAILLTIRSACTLLFMAVILPSVSWICVNALNMPPVAKDLWLARISGIVQTLGALFVAFSLNGYMLMASLVVFAAGGGMPVLIRSLANALVEEHHIGVLNSLIGFMEMIGLMIASPVLAETLKIGFEMGGLWTGLPFMFSALLCLFATVIVWAFRIPKRSRASEFG